MAMRIQRIWSVLVMTFGISLIITVCISYKIVELKHKLIVLF
jgi:hypothetical protein